MSVYYNNTTTGTEVCLVSNPLSIQTETQVIFDRCCETGLFKGDKCIIDINNGEYIFIINHSSSDFFGDEKNKKWVCSTNHKENFHIICTKDDMDKFSADSLIPFFSKNSDTVFLYLFRKNISNEYFNIPRTTIINNNITNFTLGERRNKYGEIDYPQKKYYYNHIKKYNNNDNK